MVLQKIALMVIVDIVIIQLLLSDYSRNRPVAINNMTKSSVIVIASCYQNIRIDTSKGSQNVSSRGSFSVNYLKMSRHQISTRNIYEGFKTS